MTIQATAEAAKLAFRRTLEALDPVAIPSRAVDLVLEQIDLVIDTCAAEDMTDLTAFLIEKVAPSQRRIHAFFIFLSVRAEQIRFPDASSDPYVFPEGNEKDKCIVLCYIANDFLHAVIRHGTPEQQRFLSTLQPRIHRLIDSTTKKCTKKSESSHYERVTYILRLWKFRSYLDDAFVDELQQLVEDNMDTENATWYYPEWHGKPNAPWYEQPVGAYMKQIETTGQTDPRDSPLTEEHVRPIHYGKDEKVGPDIRNAVEAFLADPTGEKFDQSLEESGARSGLDVARNDIGLTSVKDPETGQYVPNQLYFGLPAGFERIAALVREEVEEASLNNGDRPVLFSHTPTCPICNQEPQAKTKFQSAIRAQTQLPATTNPPLATPINQIDNPFPATMPAAPTQPPHGSFPRPYAGQGNAEQHPPAPGFLDPDSTWPPNPVVPRDTS